MGDILADIKEHSAIRHRFSHLSLGLLSANPLCFRHWLHILG
jgi:hypothetical protein